MSGKFTQSPINLMNVLLYPKIQQSQAWHESLEMILNIVIWFNIQFFKKCNHIRSIEHALDYILRSHLGLRNELMEALQFSFLILKCLDIEEIQEEITP